jgi:hypothetical protein
MFDIKRFHKLGRTQQMVARSGTPHVRPRSFFKSRIWWLQVLAMAVALFCVVCAVLLAFGGWGGGTPEPRSAEGPPSAVSESGPSETFDGIISDSHCGAKHSAAIGQSAADCTRACVHAGEHFVLIDREKTYILDGDPSLLKKLAGERVRVSGKLTGKSISVASATEF